VTIFEDLGAIMIRQLIGLTTATCFAASTFAAETQALKIYSAGSLRAPLTEITKAYTAAYGTPVEIVFGASGALGKRLTDGETADLFTSADRGGPEMLANAGKASPAVTFARNHLCAIVRPGLKATSASILSTLLNPSVRISTSNPQDDPGGAYAFAMFRRADSVQPGNGAKLEAKVIKIGNGPGLVVVPPGTNNTVAWLIAEKQVDVFLSYCTNGHEAEAALPGITTVELPPSLAVTASYGMTVLTAARPEASRLAMFILSPAGQKILADNGFDAPLLP
jgi:molybdate transport system substrate-binding protein